MASHFRSLPTLADLQRTRRATPKGATRLQQKTAARATAAQQEAAFKAAVWKRDGTKCRCCGQRLVHTTALVENRGEIHHAHGRGRGLRFEPRCALALCLSCHQRVSGKVGGHRLFISATKTLEINGHRYTDCSAPVVFRETVSRCR